jgi:hypothetical protein
MRRFINRKSIVSLIIAFILVSAFAGSFLLRNGTAATHAASSTTGASNNPFCSRIDHSIGASAGARLFCLGPQTSSSPQVNASSSTFGTNVDAANPQEDITPNGTRAYGQSEVSIAGNATYAVEAWNDATGFFAPCPSPMFKEELTGLGFSANGGLSFKDLGGLRNNCATGFFLFR